MPQCGFGRTDLQVSAFCLGTMTLDLQSNAMRRGQTGPEPLEPGTSATHRALRVNRLLRSPTLEARLGVGRRRATTPIRWDSRTTYVSTRSGP